MQVTQARPEDKALAMDQCAAALGLAEFSLFSRVQTGDIKAVRARSGEIMIPGGEVERLVNGCPNQPPVPDDPLLPDATLGIKARYGGLSRTQLFYRVPGLEVPLTEDTIGGYRAAFSAIFGQWQSVQNLNQQLRDGSPSPLTGAISMSPTEHWEVRSALLNLTQGEILLCQRGHEFAVIERFQGDSPYAQANGDAQMLWKGNDARALTEAFTEDARLTLAFMASNLTAKAQKIVWEQFPDHRPGHVVAAITERCHQAIANEEMISQHQRMGHRPGRGISI